VAIIQENYLNEQRVNKSIKTFVNQFNVSQLLKKANGYKNKGVPVIQIYTYLVQLLFTKKSMYMDMLTGKQCIGFSKDTVYRVLNATYINWTSFLLWLAAVVIGFVSTLTGEKRLNAIIVDDTMFERLRSKKVELLANVHDHAAKGANKFKRGFRMLTLAWTDGVTLIPMMFRHLSSADKKSRYNEMNGQIDKRTIGYRIRKEAISTATENLLSMLRQAKKAMIPAKHVVFDSWFSFPSTMMSICEIGFDVVCRLKDTTKIKYWFGGKKQTLKEIYTANKKRCGRAKYMLSVEVMIYNDKEETRRARIVFVRDRNNRKKWIAFGSTDMTLTEDGIIELYGKRWDIEVFFKICKSYIGLAREFQGISYDSMTAHTTVVMTRYIMLAVQKRQNEDPRSFGELFFMMYDEVADIKFSEVIARLLEMLHTFLNDNLGFSDKQIDEFIEFFVTKLPSFFKDPFAPLPKSA
jgi:hypothetical protein